METTRSFCGACGASLEIAPEPEWDEEDRRLIARLKGVLLALFLLAAIWIVGILSAPQDEYLLVGAAIAILPLIAPVLINTAIALKPRGMRTAYTENAFFVQAFREMVDFPGRVMRSDPPWTWLWLIVSIILLFVFTVLDRPSFQIESASDLLVLAVLYCLVIAFCVSLAYWFNHLSLGIFLRLLLSATLKSVSGGLIGSLVAAAIIGLEIAVINGVFSLGL